MSSAWDAMYQLKMTTNECPLRFEPFTTVISPSFWIALSRKKLELFKLNDAELSIWGYYSGGNARFFITEECLSQSKAAGSSSSM